uniref:Uncharacterized protein n=1 Tax=viral metagenome TaxID=1070528 RepID=A0A6M3KXI1_9ZZZZ
MTDPTAATTVPHLIGVALDSNGVAYSQVVITNRTTGKSFVKVTDANKRVVVDISQITDGYSNGDVIEIQNVGASFGGTTVTVNSTGGLQFATVTCTAALTTTLSM